MSLLDGARRGLLGNQQPTFQHLPGGRGLDLSLADDCGFFAAACGLTPDPWQQTVIDAWLTRRTVASKTKWAADRCGLAVPRQNGKNGAVEMVELFKMVDLGRRILHTAHEVKTARKAFLRLAGFFEDGARNPDLAAMVETIRYANGQEGIWLRNGGSCEFIARSKNSGRGFTVDDLVADEAQEFSVEALEALLPTLSAAPSGDPQTILTGTPPYGSMAGEVFTRMRVEAHEGVPGRLAWLEWAVEPVDGLVDLDDAAAVARVNPAVGDRITWDAVANERALMDDAGFARERLGLWAAEAKLEVIPRDRWVTLGSNRPPAEDARRVFAVDMTPDRLTAVVAVACDVEAGTHVELVLAEDTSGGTGRLVEWLTDAKRRRVPVVVDAYSPAASLVTELGTRRCTVTSARDLAAACGMFVDAVRAGTVEHFNQERLNKAVGAATKRPLGDGGGWAWNRRDADRDISPLVAVTLALWGLKTKQRRSGKVVFA